MVAKEANSTIIMDLEGVKTTIEVAEVVLEEVEATIKEVVTKCRWEITANNINNNNSYNSKCLDTVILNRCNKTCQDQISDSNRQSLNSQPKLFIFLNMIVSRIKS